jgi:regulator of sirC expression with transglutaminase-like and TPR domain
MEHATQPQGGQPSRPAAPPPGDVPALVRAILARPDEELDYARAKLALDRIIDPALDADRVLAAIDRLAEAASRLAGAGASSGARLAALRRQIYERGPWNDYHPCDYDHSDPDGTHIPNKLLHVYLRRRLGNCVSMPILFLILARRLGLDMALASAPLHIFLRYRSPEGGIFNLETTSGGHPARDEWYRHNFPMSDRALASGLYMRSLTRREGVALMATTVLEHLLLGGRHEEAIAVARIILEHDPRAGQVMAAQGTAYGRLLEVEFIEKYPIPYLIPEALRPRRLMLIERNVSLFSAAEALGWEPVE